MYEYYSQVEEKSQIQKKKHEKRKERKLSKQKIGAGRMAFQGSIFALALQFFPNV